jgi:hypothetical protein
MRNDRDGRKRQGSADANDEEQTIQRRSMPANDEHRIGRV